MTDLNLPETDFDCIIVGTGITESILSGALSRIEKKVLHLDIQETYGSQFSTFNLNEFHTFLKYDGLPINPEQDEEEENPMNDNTNNVNEQEPTNINETPKAFYQSNFELIKEEDYYKNPQNNLFRKFLIDLTGQRFLFCRGPMVDLFIQSGVGRYLEFRCLDALLIYDTKEKNKFQLVPSTKGEIFKTKFISLKEKNRLVKFITFCMEYKENEEKLNLFNEFKDELFDLFLEKTQMLGSTLEEMKHLKDVIIHAICLLDNSNNIKTKDVMERLSYYLNSLGRYGNSAFLYPIYGISELSQAFCRLSAVYGGVYVLRRGIHQIKVVNNQEENNEGNQNVKISVGSGSQELTCDHLIINNDTVPNNNIDLSNNKNLDKIIRSIVICEQPIFNANDYKKVEENTNVGATILAVIPPNQYEYQPCAIYISQLDHLSCVAPRGKYLITFQMRIPHNVVGDMIDYEEQVIKMLEDCIQQYIPKEYSVINKQEEEEETNKKNIIYKCIYKQYIRDNRSHPFYKENEEIKERIHVCSDAMSDFMQVDQMLLKEAKTIFDKIVGNEDKSTEEKVPFLPKIPDPMKSENEEEELFDETTKLLGIDKKLQTTTLDDNNEMIENVEEMEESNIVNQEENNNETTSDENVKENVEKEVIVDSETKNSSTVEEINNNEEKQE
ncbi:hypothetical protein ABK040_002137 [Willaertia magna]